MKGTFDGNEEKVTSETEEFPSYGKPQEERENREQADQESILFTVLIGLVGLAIVLFVGGGLIVLFGGYFLPSWWHIRLSLGIFFLGTVLLPFLVHFPWQRLD